MPYLREGIGLKAKGGNVGAKKESRVAGLVGRGLL